jgi:hypothetical protein
MKLKIEESVIVPLGVIKKFMSQCDELDFSDDDPDNSEFDPDNSEFNHEIKYPPVNYNGDFYWNEMSYRRLTDTTLTWSYDFYSNGDW